jgi:hypothetical protein
VPEVTINHFNENNKTTKDIYAKVKFNRPEQLIGVVNTALKPAACKE